MLTHPTQPTSTYTLTPLQGLSRTMAYGLVIGDWSCSLLTKANGHTNLLGSRGRAGWSSLQDAVAELVAERAAKAGPANLVLPTLPTLPVLGGWAL